MLPHPCCSEVGINSGWANKSSELRTWPIYIWANIVLYKWACLSACKYIHLCYSNAASASLPPSQQTLLLRTGVFNVPIGSSPHLTEKPFENIGRVPIKSWWSQLHRRVIHQQFQLGHYCSWLLVSRNTWQIYDSGDRSGTGFKWF